MSRIKKSRTASHLQCSPSRDKRSKMEPSASTASTIIIADEEEDHGQDEKAVQPANVRGMKCPLCKANDTVLPFRLCPQHPVCFTCAHTAMLLHSGSSTPIKCNVCERNASDVFANLSYNGKWDDIAKFLPSPPVWNIVHPGEDPIACPWGCAWVLKNYQSLCAHLNVCRNRHAKCHTCGVVGKRRAIRLHDTFHAQESVLVGLLPPSVVFGLPSDATVEEIRVYTCLLADLITYIQRRRVHLLELMDLLSAGRYRPLRKLYPLHLEDRDPLARPSYYVVVRDVDPGYDGEDDDDDDDDSDQDTTMEESGNAQ